MMKCFRSIPLNLSDLGRTVKSTGKPTKLVNQVAHSAKHIYYTFANTQANRAHDVIPSKSILRTAVAGTLDRAEEHDSKTEPKRRAGSADV